MQPTKWQGEMGERDGPVARTESKPATTWSAAEGSGQMMNLLFFRR